MQRFVLGVILAALLSAPVASAQSRTHNATPAMKADESRSTGESGTEIKDSWLTTKTKAKLFADRHVKGRKISVDTHGGIVTLRGKVESAQAKNAAEQIARRVDGVKGVTSLLQVVPDRQRKFVDAKDDDMKGAVTARFDKDAGLKSADIKVRSDNALVTLMGTVPNARAKVRAGDLARGVPGVRTVRNELRLSETRSDVKTSSDVKVRRSPTPPSAQTPPLSVSEKAPSSP